MYDDQPTQREISQDVQINLEREWNNPSYVTAESFTIQDSPRMRWHQHMREAWDKADAGERINLTILCRRVAELENQLVAAGINTALLGTDRDPRAHCHTAEVPEEVQLQREYHTADSYTPQQSASASITTVDRLAYARRQPRGFF